MEKEGVDRIDLFLPPGSPFGTLSHLTLRFAEALMEEGVRCRVLEAERFNPRPFLEKLFSEPPDYTLSFNGLLPDSEGNVFADMIRIPHVAFLLEPPTRFISLAASPFTLFACADLKEVEFFESLTQGNKKPLFLMPGVEKELLEEDREKERGFDVVFFGTVHDPEDITNEAKKVLNAHCFDAMHESINIMKEAPDTWYVDAFVAGFNVKGYAASPDADYLLALQFFEEYVVSESRVSLIEAFSSFTCDVFVTPVKHIPKRLQKLSNLRFHESVPFEQMIEIMQHAKVVLQNSPLFRHGAGERLFYSLASGAVVVSDPTPFITSTFKDGKDLLLINSHIQEHVKEVLSNSKMQEEIAFSVRQKLYADHTWNARAHELLRHLNKE